MSASRGHEQIIALFRDSTTVPDEHQLRQGLATLASDANSATATVGDDSSAVLAVEDVAALLRVGRNTVYALVAQNKIPHRRLGKAIRFSREAVMAWLSSWSGQVAK